MKATTERRAAPMPLQAHRAAGGRPPRCTSAADVPATLWRNGGGIARVLLAGPAGAAWQWRISVAEIAADGPCSSFDGTVRWLALLGGGVDLFVDGICQRLSPAVSALRFDGQAATDCRVTAAPIRALNLMLRGLHGAKSAASDGIAWSTPASLMRPLHARCGLLPLQRIRSHSHRDAAACRCAAVVRPDAGRDRLSGGPSVARTGRLVAGRRRIPRPDRHAEPSRMTALKEPAR